MRRGLQDQPADADDDQHRVERQLGKPSAPAFHPAPVYPLLLVSTTLSAVGRMRVNGTRTAPRASLAFSALSTLPLGAKVCGSTAGDARSTDMR